jgi:hypothetical protein
MLNVPQMLLTLDHVEIDVRAVPLRGTALSKEARGSADSAAPGGYLACFPLGPQAVYLALWEEFELGDSAGACFAGAIDRLQPGARSPPGC